LAGEWKLQTPQGARVAGVPAEAARKKNKQENKEQLNEDYVNAMLQG
jgi:hypothetical protein